jgi:hypothetical protein
MKIRTDNWRVSPQEDNEKIMENKPEENDKKKRCMHLRTWRKRVKNYY